MRGLGSRLTFCWFAAVALVAAARPAWADHSHEGQVELEQLLKRAELNELNTKEFRERWKAAETAVKARQGAAFLPVLSLEAGPVSSRIDGEKESGQALAAKAEWNLIRGGADSANIQLAKIQEELTRLQMESALSRIRRKVSEHYYRLLFLGESLELQERARKLNSEQRAIAQRKRRAGLTSSTDVLEFELRENTIASDMMMLRSNILGESQVLGTYLKLDSPGEIRVKGHLEGKASKPLNLARAKSELAKSLDLQSSRLGVEAARMELRSARAEFSPQLDLEAQYGKLFHEERVTDESDDYAVRLKLSLPLFSGLSTFNQQRSKGSELKAHEAKLAKQTQEKMTELSMAFQTLETLEQRLKIEEANLQKSEEYYKITLEEYRRGVKNSPDIVGASERLLNAKIRNLEFRRDLELGRLRVFEILDSDPSRLSM